MIKNDYKKINKYYYYYYFMDILSTDLSKKLLNEFRTLCMKADIKGLY